MFHRARQLAGHVIPNVLRPLQILWNEMLGFVFLIIGGIIAIRTYMSHSRGEDLSIVLMQGFFAAILLFYGLSSFKKARKISRP
jgi:hypothetical protein